MTQPVADNWNKGEPYERYVGRWSRQIAPIFLTWLGTASGQTWLDLGCGTGAVSAAIARYNSPAWIIGMDTSSGYLRTALDDAGRTARMVQGSAMEIPLCNAAVDVVVAGLVLNFANDTGRMAREMARVARNRGIVGGYVWDYGDKMEFMRYFWDTATELWPDVATIDQGSRFPLCHPQPLMDLLVGAGLRDVQVTAIDLPTIFTSFDDYWLPFLGGQGSAPSYLQTLDEISRDRLRDRLSIRLPTQIDGAIHLVARVWAFRAMVEK